MAIPIIALIISLAIVCLVFNRLRKHRQTTQENYRVREELLPEKYGIRATQVGESTLQVTITLYRQSDNVKTRNYHKGKYFFSSGFVNHYNKTLENFDKFVIKNTRKIIPCEPSYMLISDWLTCAM